MTNESISGSQFAIARHLVRGVTWAALAAHPEWNYMGLRWRGEAVNELTLLFCFVLTDFATRRERLAARVREA